MPPKSKILILSLMLFSGTLLAKEHKHEIAPEIMMDNADAMRGLSLGAIQYAYHINQEIWVGLDGFLGSAVVDSGSGLTAKNGDLIWGGTPVFYYNVPALLGATKEKPEGSQVHLYTSLGVGYMNIGGEQTPLGIFGGGLLWESGLPWLGVRFDLKGMFYMLKNTKGSNFNSDLALSIGPSFIF